MDKLLKDAETTGGVIDSVVLDPKEAYGLILELFNLGRGWLTNIAIEEDGNNITHQLLIWNGGRLDKNESVKAIVNSWYKTKYVVRYKDVPVIIVKPKLELPPPEPVAANQDGWDTVDTIKKTTGLDAVKIPVNKPPEPPKPPPNRLLQEGNTLGYCDKCGSSLKSKWLFFKKGGCINPECEDYWKTYKE